MRKSLLILGLSLALFSCNKEETTTTTAGFKTAYVDTVKLVENSDELKDFDARAKVREEELSRELQGKARQLELDAASFEQEARQKGMQWAQLRQQDLQKRQQQLLAQRQEMTTKFQNEFGVERDTIISKMRKYIKTFGKKQGYDFIYGTGDAATVLYAKESYDLTDKMIKELNDQYKSSGKKEETPEQPAKTEEDKK